jgi:tryptophan synthase beta chain
MKYNQPDVNGKFGEFGGKYVAETLMPAVLELEEAYNKAKESYRICHQRLIY